MSIQVVNMVPQSLSGDTNFDSEPSVTVDPSNPQRLVGTAFRPDAAAGSTTGPYFSSTDCGVLSCSAGLSSTMSRSAASQS